MYAELVPQIVQQLVSYLEITGPTTEDLFGGEPSIRQINDLIDDLNAAGEHADVDQVARGNPRLAAATLAAYIRQLPEPLVNEDLHAPLDTEVYVELITLSPSLSLSPSLTLTLTLSLTRSTWIGSPRCATSCPR